LPSTLRVAGLRQPVDLPKRCSLFTATAELVSSRSLGELAFSPKFSLVVADPNENPRHPDSARPQPAYLSLLKMSSGANVFEISDIQEDEAEAVQ
jgi:hypothetical protein